MILKRISILNYKNIEQADLTLSDKLNCFIGKNGMGKTNLLDAVHFLSFCKSANNAIDSQNIRHEADFFLIQGFYDADNGTPEEVYCGMKRKQKKQFKRNKKEYQRLSDHIGLIPLVMISPGDAALILGGSDERRRFMDVVISQYDKHYLDALIHYNRALAQRNSLLKSERMDEGTMTILEEMMAGSGETIYRKREAFVEKLTPLFQQFHSDISGGQEQVRLEYESHARHAPLTEVLASSREKDRIVGFSLHGIHKDDLHMTLGGFPIKREGSQGQNKTYLTALKLAQFELLKRVGTTPLLLLDDLFDKLDAHRVEQIIKLVGSERFGQIFITDTNRENLDRMLRTCRVNHRVFLVDNGAITPLEETAQP